MSELSGMIFNIQKFSIHDGNGIRTMVFMKGCPLRCIWCCNPESQHAENEILFLKDRCIGCQRCVSLCPNKALEIDRDKCLRCGRCSAACPAAAKRSAGREVTVNELVAEVEKDRLFYRNSGGGVTVSGGEPLVQYGFVKAFLTRCQYLGIHTAIETCGHAKWETMHWVLDSIDQVFMDLKCMNNKKHEMLTGVGNDLILENAAKLAKLKKDITFRIPLIPGCNDDRENITATAEFVKKISPKESDIKVEILPYHRLGEMKFAWMDQEYALKGTAANNLNQKNEYTAMMAGLGIQMVQ